MSIIDIITKKEKKNMVGVKDENGRLIWVPMGPKYRSNTDKKFAIKHGYWRKPHPSMIPPGEEGRYAVTCWGVFELDKKYSTYKDYEKEWTPLLTGREWLQLSLKAEEETKKILALPSRTMTAEDFKELERKYGEGSR